MRIVRTVRGMQGLSSRTRAGGIKIGFVPTMGYLHAGHMSLVKRARQLVGASGQVVVSIYVNPTQFGPNEDLAKYPRDLKRDIRLCRAAGTDVLFVPDSTDMYAGSHDQPYSTYVVEEGLSRVMEGVSRPTHFRGVLTIVAKLFHIVQPEVAVFGQKDWQQATLVQRMVRDLNFPMKIVVAPTVREQDGLAMSSRNKYLSPIEREQATALWKSIQLARGLLRKAGGGLPVRQVQKELVELISRHPAARIDYISFFDPMSLRPVAAVERGTHLALAVFVGRTRLIDNARL
jgi:pantoate--beta-alanine ligase